MFCEQSLLSGIWQVKQQNKNYKDCLKSKFSNVEILAMFHDPPHCVKSASSLKFYPQQLSGRWAHWTVHLQPPPAQTVGIVQTRFILVCRPRMTLGLTFYGRSYLAGRGSVGAVTLQVAGCYINVTIVCSI